MIRLTREVRFFLNDPQPWTPDSPSGNTWAGWPGPLALAPYVELRTTATGQIDPQTGFVCNTAVIDKAIRSRGVRVAERLMTGGRARVTPEQLLTALLEEAGTALPESIALESMELVVSPQLSYRACRPDPEQPTMIAVTEQFEFSAGHRLHCEDFSEEENRRLFGKCNNPSGHGHNYVLEVTVAGSTAASPGRAIPLHQLEETVNRVVIDRFDHKNLNVDVAEFHDLNPTVENIARVIFHLLENEFSPARLESVRVYETPKTWADYRGPVAD